MTSRERLLSALVSGVLVVAVLTKLYIAAPVETVGWDVLAFIASGDAWIRGAGPYSLDELARFCSRYGLEPAPINLCPPFVLPVFGLLSRLPLPAAAAAWFLLHTGLVVATVATLVRRTGSWWPALALASEPLWTALELGQIYPLMLPAALVVWEVSPKEPPRWAVGAALGLLCAIKPNFLAGAVVVLLAGEWLVAAAAVVVFAAIQVGSAVASPDTYLAWVAALTAEAQRQRVEVAVSISLPTHIGAPFGPFFAAIPLSVMLAVALATRSVPRRGDLLAMGVLGACLAAPIAWVGYLLVLLPWWARRRSILALIAGFLVCIPSRIHPVSGPFATVDLVATMLLFVDAALAAFGRTPGWNELSPEAVPP